MNFKPLFIMFAVFEGNLPWTRSIRSFRRWHFQILAIDCQQQGVASIPQRSSPRYAFSILEIHLQIDFTTGFGQSCVAGWLGESVMWGWYSSTISCFPDSSMKWLKDPLYVWTNGNSPPLHGLNESMIFPSLVATCSSVNLRDGYTSYTIAILMVLSMSL